MILHAIGFSLMAKLPVTIMILLNTSGVKFRKLSVKLHRGLPSIRFLMDNLFREDPEEYIPTKFCGRILRCGIMIDGSSLVQSFLSVHTKGDTDHLCCFNTEPVPAEFHRKMIKSIPGNPVYCHLDITDVPFDFGKAFSTVTYSGKTVCQKLLQLLSRAIFIAF